MHRRTGMRAAAVLLLVGAVGLHAGQRAVQEAGPDLYAQATGAMLNREFPSPAIDYLVLDLRSGQTVAMRWPGAENPLPAGSLLKPFVALAYSQLHASTGEGDRFPAVVCHGKSDGCWRTGGHGSLRLERALAASCNAYFLALARDVSASGEGMEVLRRVASEYRLPPPAASGQDAGALIGVSPEWRIPPLALARAYALLTEKQADPTALRLLAGMKLAALPGGTAARVGRHPGGVLAKTGTAPCVPLSKNRRASRSANPADRCVADGDGLAVVMAPAEAPRVLLLVRERGTTGAMTAEVAGRMLGRMEEAHANAR